MPALDSQATALTAGDPAGIGPELLARLLAEIAADAGEPVVVFTRRSELERGFSQAGIPEAVDEVLAADHIRIVETDLDPHDLPVGTPSEAGGAWALRNLDLALDAHERGEVAGITFAPLNKSSLHLAGMHHNDELRWFENRLGHPGVVSELNVIDGLWTSRVTSHVSHREAPALVTAQRVHEVIALLDRYLRGSGIDAPRIAVCALNPHGGENGRFGREEIDEIAPGIAAARAAGLLVEGPFPADTLFLRARADFDGVVTMYHDQGQIALKMMGFDGGVTVEGGLGLPICTPAHGTAFDRVGTGTASLTSMRNAYRLTRTLSGTDLTATLSASDPTPA